MDRLVAFFHRTPKLEPPSISPWAAAGLSICYTLIYVIPFYLSSKTRPSPLLSRDASSVIRARIRAVTFSCVVTCCITVYLAVQNAHLSPAEIAHALGWWPISLLDVAKTLALVTILFIGPLFESGIVEGGWRDWIRGRGLMETLSSAIGFRTYVAGPVTEEIVFRSLIIPLHLFAHLSPAKLVFITPLYFGIAHIHHFYEYTLTHPHTPITPALLRSLFQFAYTSLFGFHAAFVFLRTGSLIAVILTHTFCNWMGLPRFWGRIEAPTPIGPPDADRSEITGHPFPGAFSTPTAQVVDGRLHVGWTVAYYVLLVSGAAGFFRSLWPLTESPHALVTGW